MIPDKLKSYVAARRHMGLRIDRQHKGLNNRVENSHLPTRRRERIMTRFKSPRQVQKFLPIHDQVANLFHFPVIDFPLSTIAPLAPGLLRVGLRSGPLGLPHEIRRLRRPLHGEIIVVNLMIPFNGR